MLSEQTLRKALNDLYKTPKAEEEHEEECMKERCRDQLKLITENLADEVKPEPVNSPTSASRETGSPLEVLLSLTDGTVFANR